MPEIKKASDILDYVTPEELEAHYVRFYRAYGMTLADAIVSAKERIRRIQHARV